MWRSLPVPLRTKSFPCCENRKASRTKSPWSPQGDWKRSGSASGTRKRMRKLTAAQPIPKCRRHSRKWLRELLRCKTRRSRTRPSTRSPPASQPKADGSCSFSGGGQVRPLSSAANRKCRYKKKRDFDAYEDHEVDFHFSVGPGGLMALPRQLRNTTGGIGGLCGGSPGRPDSARGAGLLGGPNREG